MSILEFSRIEITYLELGSVLVDILEQRVEVFSHSVHVILIEIFEIITQGNQHIVSSLEQRCFLLVLINNQLGPFVNVVFTDGHHGIAPQRA